MRFQRTAGVQQRTYVISRQWRGVATSTDADRYVAYLKADTFPQLETIPGFVAASILRRELAEGTEFLVVTEWQSMKAIEGFAGSDPWVAVVPDIVKKMMLEYDTRVRHYTIVESSVT